MTRDAWRRLTRSKATWTIGAWILAGGVAIAHGALITSVATAQEPFEEEPDPTRLDVERLPPEAIEVTRDLYAHGFFLESMIGARGFIGGVGRFSNAGPYLNIGFGYEIWRWLWVKLSVDGSIHRTDAPRPPSPAAFELLDVMAEVRFQLDLSARAALWLGGEFGLGFVTTDVLRTYGLNETDNIGLIYGGQLGFDWHMRNRHHSIGVLGGSRLHPNLQGPDGELAIGVHGALYLRYVF